LLPESLDVLLSVVDVFERLEIPYLVGGSMASALYGVARSTLDADVVVELYKEQVPALVAALGDSFYADEEMIRDAIQNRSSFNLIHLKTMFKVDVFIRKDRPFDRVQFERKVEQIISIDPEQKAFISSAEDIVLAKLEWYRLGGEVSDRQWRDILGVLKVQAGRLDLDYLNEWAVELNVLDLLKRALIEIS
jgi:hypothetical protein